MDLRNVTSAVYGLQVAPAGSTCMVHNYGEIIIESSMVVYTEITKDLDETLVQELTWCSSGTPIPRLVTSSIHLVVTMVEHGYYVVPVVLNLLNTWSSVPVAMAVHLGSMAKIGEPIGVEAKVMVIEKEEVLDSIGDTILVDAFPLTTS